MSTAEKTLAKRLEVIEEKLDNLASDDIELLHKNIQELHEVIGRVERLIENEIINPLQRTSAPASLAEVRDKLNELLRKVG